MPAELLSKPFEDLCSEYRIDPNNIPKHMAIITDGNGRWAQSKNKKRTEGHLQGGEIVRHIIKIASKLNVQHLSFYSFSTENWKRPSEEVNYLMGLSIKFVHQFSKELLDRNVKVKILGYQHNIPLAVKASIHSIESLTKKNTGLQVNFMFNYGSRQEILDACSNYAKAYQKNPGLKLDEASFSTYLLTKNIPDPDLLIRTSNELRISNFLLWQISYAELFFTDTLWPDFTQEEFIDIICQFQNRKRRFGDI